MSQKFKAFHVYGGYRQAVKDSVFEFLLVGLKNRNWVCEDGEEH